MFKKRFLLITSLVAIVVCFLYIQSQAKTISKEDAIQAIMEYPMTDIIKRCQKDYNYSDEDMVILEKELKRFFILSAVKTPHAGGTGMYNSDVDNLWHTFILFTKDYADFCQKHMKHFIHHIPETEETKRDPDYSIETQKDFQAFINNYQEIFNEEIHPIWLLDMC
jgi:hypothetical protein